eukprot:TRINITY_DN8146_c0_g1_i6.p1 TRINITY_DN8146_c0_g1~~TRINITY_DN8146_c0_g1_i6.p1  ORF type:complete len:174 (+),score=39.44 TRINITY_DN8146_c0_g1_i6:126-647(+)
MCIRDRVEKESQLKAALLLQRVWRNRGVWTRVLQYKRRACSGAQFMKYGRSGSPHMRLVYLSDDLLKICWAETKHGKRPNKDSFIRVSDITDLIQGRSTDVFKNQKSAATSYYSAEQQARVDAERSFSLICGTARTLDLEADSKLQAESYLRVLRFVLVCKGRIGEDCLPHLK